MGAYILIIMAIATGPATPTNSRPSPSDGKWPVITMQQFDDLQACKAALKVIGEMSRNLKVAHQAECIASSTPPKPGQRP